MMLTLKSSARSGARERLSVREKGKGALLHRDSSRGIGPANRFVGAHKSSTDLSEQPGEGDSRSISIRERAAQRRYRQRVPEGRRTRMHAKIPPFAAPKNRSEGKGQSRELDFQGLRHARRIARRTSSNLPVR